MLEAFMIALGQIIRQLELLKGDKVSSLDELHPQISKTPTRKKEIPLGKGLIDH